MVGFALTILGPLIVTCGVAVITIYVLGDRGELLEARLAPIVLLLAQVGTVVLAWVLIQTAPDIVSSYSGADCKDVVGAGKTFDTLVLSSALIGGLAWGSAVRQVGSSLGRLAVYGPLAVILPYAIGVVYALHAACSTWN